MRKIIVKELTEDSFRLYGQFQNLFEIDRFRLGDAGTSEFYPDILTMDLGGKTPSFSIARVSECPCIIDSVEYHQHTGEGILPLDGDCIIFVGRSSWEVRLDFIEAFRIPKGTLVRLKPGVLHGRQFTCGRESVNVLIVLPERTYGNDCVFISLDIKQKIEIQMN